MSQVVLEVEIKVPTRLKEDRLALQGEGKAGHQQVRFH